MDWLPLGFHKFIEGFVLKVSLFIYVLCQLNQIQHNVKNGPFDFFYAFPNFAFHLEINVFMPVIGEVEVLGVLLLHKTEVEQEHAP